MSQRMITVIVIAVVFYLIGVKFPQTGATVLGKIGM